MYKYAIALTGGIATGKSTVCNLLKLYGFAIIDADEIAHEVLDENYNKIEELFGKEFVKENRVDRKKLGSLVFSNNTQRLKLEKLLHPLIRKKIEILSEKLDSFKVPYFIDIPLFFEKRGFNIKKSVLVYAPKDIQLQRLIKREGKSLKDAKKIVDVQMDIENKKELADFIVDNTKDLKHLQSEVERLVDFIKDTLNWR
jgi:dephospho-CoA kinase